MAPELYEEVCVDGGVDERRVACMRAYGWGVGGQVQMGLSPGQRQNIPVGAARGGSIARGCWGR
eukprot:354858-Chlamydomonas_euryale.AAC.2